MILPSALMSLVNRIESSANVHLRYMGIDCWPVVRNSFMSVVSHSHAKRQRKIRVINYLFSFFDLCYSLCAIGKVGAIVLTDEKYQAKVNDKLCYKDASVIKELLGELCEKCQIFTQNAPKIHKRNSAERSIFFITALAVVGSKILMRLDFRKTVQNYLEHIFTCPELKEINFDGLKNSKQVKQNIYFVIVASFLFEILLKRLRPKKCFIVCYYSCLGMALCAACKKLDIESVDIQHGVSGSNMRAYGQWSNLPSKGLNTLPACFYCWTLMDVEAVEEWSNNTPSHQAVLTGNIWRAYLIEKEQQCFSDNLDLFKEMEACRKIILYTARTISLPELFLDLLKISPNDYLYIIRLHPDTQADDMEALMESLKITGASCYVDNGLNIKIQESVKLVDVHVTEWSAVVYDAYFEGIPSIVISEVGRDYFHGFNRKGYITYSRDAKEILSEIPMLSKIKSEESISLSEVGGILIGDFLL